MAELSLDVLLIIHANESVLKVRVRYGTSPCRRGDRTGLAFKIDKVIRLRRLGRDKSSSAKATVWVESVRLEE